MAKTEKEKEEKSLKILKTVVISMGVLLIVGTFALFIAVLQKASSTSTEPKKVVYKSAPVEAAPAPIKCIYKDAELPLKRSIISATTENNLLTIVTKQAKSVQSVSKVQDGNSLTLSADKGQTSQQVIIYDLCEGKALSTFNFVASE